MIYEYILENLFLLKLIKVGFFIFMFVFSNSYLIPKGILFYLEWKEKKEYRKLSTSISFLASGLFIFIYFLAMFILDSAKHQ